MRRLIASGVFLALLLATGRADLSACGEKFFFVGRLVTYRQQTMAGSPPGSVLLYTNPASKLPAIIKETKLDELLKSAGHKVDTVSEVGALKGAVNSGRYDLLLVDVDDVAQASQWKSAAPGLVVVPVLYRPTRTESAAADRTYSRILKDPGKANDVLALVNDVVRSHKKGRTTS